MPSHTAKQKPRHYKKRRKDNSAYRPGQKLYGKSSCHSKEKISAIRMDNRMEFPLFPGSAVNIPVTTAVYLLKHPTIVNFRQFETTLQQQFKAEIPTHAVITEIYQQDADGLPIAVGTADGKTLFANRFDGNMVYLSNLPERIPLNLLSHETSLAPGSNFLESSPYKAVVTPVKEKVQSCIITNKDYQAAKKENNLNGGRRLHTQAEVMKRLGADSQKSRTKKYITATELFSDDNYEASHLRPYSSQGEKSQTPDNLVYMHRSTNTEAMPIEEVLRQKAMQTEVTYQVRAPLIPSTHVAKDAVIIQLSTPKKSSVTFKLDPQNPNVPHKSQASYVEIYCQTLFDHTKKARPDQQPDVLYNPTKTIAKPGRKLNFSS